MAGCKRENEFGDSCVFCEGNGGTHDQKLSSPSSVGRDKIRSLLPILRKNNRHRQLSDRLGAVDDELSEVKYHKNCYRTFIREHDTKTPQQSEENRRSTRQPMDLAACIFCQDPKRKADLHVVKTPQMAQRVRYGCETHPSMSRRIPPYLDLIAAGIQYHNKCYVSFLRESWRAGLKSATSTRPTSEDALQVLADELFTDAANLQVHAKSAFQRYLELCDELGVEVPCSYMSRMQTFVRALERRLCEIVETCEIKAVQGVGTFLTTTTKSEPKQKSDDEDHTIAQDLSQLARAIRSELRDAPSYEGFHGDQDSATACVPSVLLTFIRQLLGAEESGDGDGTDRYALSIAQDIVYCASKGRKWTPKHVGLANTLHQETRSKRLVQMVHNAGHCLSYKQLLTVTTGLAEAVLRSTDESTGAVVPPNLVPDKFVHFALDNIDILDESLDGKNTFHATQVR